MEKMEHPKNKAKKVVDITGRIEEKKEQEEKKRLEDLRKWAKEQGLPEAESLSAEEIFRELKGKNLEHLDYSEDLHKHG